MNSQNQRETAANIDNPRRKPTSTPRRLQHKVGGRRIYHTLRVSTEQPQKERQKEKRGEKEGRMTVRKTEKKEEKRRYRCGEVESSANCGREAAQNMKRRPSNIGAKNNPACHLTHRSRLLLFPSPLSGQLISLIFMDVCSGSALLRHR